MDYPLSEDIQDCLDLYREVGLIRSSLMTMNVDPDRPGDPISDAENHISDSLSGSPKAIYLAESTNARSTDLVKNAEKILSSGYLTHGVRMHLESPVNWELFTSQNRSVRYKIQSLIVCDSVLRADSAKRERRWYEPSLRYIQDWVSNFIVDEGRDQYQWYDMAVGLRAAKLAYIVRRAIEEKEEYRLLAPLIVAADIHAQELMREDKIALHSNHGLFQMSGLLSLGRLLPFLSRSEEAVQFAKDKILFMLENQFAEDGLHKEHSPIYHMYITNYVYSIRRSNFLEDTEEFEVLAEKATKAASWMIQPDGTVLPFGDSPPSQAIRKADFPLNMENGKPSPPFGFKYFQDGGLVVNCTPDKEGGAGEYLAFNGSFFSRQHKHSDDMGIQFFSDGKGVLTDAGFFAYLYDQEERIFVESTRAHNCLEIDGFDYSRFNNDIFGNCIDFAEKIGDCVFIQGTVNRSRLVPADIPYNKVKDWHCEPCQIKQKRLVFYLPGKFLIIIDDIKSMKNRNYTQWFNLSSGVSAVLGNEEIVVRDSNEVRCVIRSLQKGPINASLVNGQVEPRLQGWFSPNGNILEKIDSIGIEGTGKHSIIGTMFDLEFEKTPKIALNVGSGGNYLKAVVDRSGKRYEMIIRQKSSQVSLEFIEDGEITERLIEE